MLVVSANGTNSSCTDFRNNTSCVSPDRIIVLPSPLFFDFSECFVRKSILTKAGIAILSSCATFSFYRFATGVAILFSFSSLWRFIVLSRRTRARAVLRITCFCATTATSIQEQLLCMVILSQDTYDILYHNRRNMSNV